MKQYIPSYFVFFLVATSPILLLCLQPHLGMLWNLLLDAYLRDIKRQSKMNDIFEVVSRPAIS